MPPSTAEGAVRRVATRRASQEGFRLPVGPPPSRGHEGYVELATGERVVLVDAAQAVATSDGDLVVVPGRLLFHDPEHPELIPLAALE